LLSDVPAKPQVGRPVVLTEAQRRGVVLDAAARVFLARGYAAATMSAIALDARMSKKTLYQVFPSKLALLDALLEDRIFQLSLPPDLGGEDQAERLTRLVLAIADILLRPERTGLIRLVITDGQASPELATAFERLKMGNKLNALEVWVGEEMESGGVPPGDARELARMLFGMTICEPLLSALIRAPHRADESTIEHRVSAAVRIFLRGLGG
jgi:AcrR family transcriptional regulator